MRRSIFTPFLLAIWVLPCAAGATEAKRDSKDVPGLINALSDPDSALRDQAAEQLIEIGTPARAEIVKAARDDNPETRAQAARILRKLPWSTADDSLEVRNFLEGYGDADDTARIGITKKIDDAKAPATLLRLFGEEPSDAVRWLIAWWLRDSDDATLKQLRAADPEADDAPALFLAAEAWMERDRARSLALYRRCIDAHAIRPTNDSGVLSRAFSVLFAAALEAQDFDQAAELLRKQVPRERTFRRSPIRAGPETIVPSLANLLALHEYFGPLRGYTWDVQTWSVEPMHPTLIGSISRVLAPLGFAPPLPPGLTADFAPSQHYGVGQFLFLQSLPDAAEIELRRALATNRRRPEFLEPRILALLGTMAAGRDDDAAAVELLDRAFALKGREPLEVTYAQSDQPLRSEDDLRAELHFRRAKLAQAAGNTARADHEVEQLVDITPANTDAAIKTIVWLKETSRTAQAKTLFKRVHDDAAAGIKESSHGRATQRNDLAWLSARCGENLDEAVQLAQQAVDEAPAIAAFLDTLAEAKYRTGHTEEAIKLEMRALELSPDAKFMKDQIVRFKAGKP